MSDYPVTDIFESSSYSAITDNTVNIGPNGSVRVASNNTVYDSYNFLLDHKLIATATKDLILSHYDSDKLLEFNYLCDIDYTTYLCIYISEPTVTWVREDLWNVRTSLQGH